MPWNDHGGILEFCSHMDILNQCRAGCCLVPFTVIESEKGVVHLAAPNWEEDGIKINTLHDEVTQKVKIELATLQWPLYSRFKIISCHKHKI